MMPVPLDVQPAGKPPPLTAPQVPLLQVYIVPVEITTCTGGEALHAPEGATATYCTEGFDGCANAANGSARNSQRNLRIRSP
jgi:hypothetical protein